MKNKLPLFFLALLPIAAQADELSEVVHHRSIYQTCDREVLTDLERIAWAFRDGVKSTSMAMGHRIAQVREETPEGDAFSLAAFLDGGHIVVQTYPLSGSCYVDYFSTGEEADWERFQKVFSSYLDPESVIDSDFALSDHKEESDKNK